MPTCPTCGTAYPTTETHCAHDGVLLLPDALPEGFAPEVAFPEAAPAEGENILDGRYRLLDTLGVGTVGAVYKAEHLWMRKTVAIKLLKPEVISSDEAIRRFAREARLASLIDNPHCVSVHDFARSQDGTFYLVMEYLEGQSLFDM